MLGFNNTSTLVCHFMSSQILIVLGFYDMSTLVGHFVSSPREGRKEIEETVKEMKERYREDRETGMKERKQKK